ncbi:MAG: DUF523 domain-containing protein [Enterobacterales bacterium]|nr:DUF523 domain-containing protein [Enterobacterales bacterium]
MTAKILFSACLLGEKVRYDGQHKLINSPVIQRWLAKDLIVTACPEVIGGLSIPRTPAEIMQIKQPPSQLKNDNTDHRLVIMDKNKQDVTQAFVDGANKTLAICQLYQIKMAVMTDGSPSCASSQIYDGSFTGKKIAGQGVTAQLLQNNGITVFSQSQLALAEKYYQSLNS